ncbi:MAG: DUF2182 domain-containing protein [Thermoleophilia bacterium]
MSVDAAAPRGIRLPRLEAVVVVAALCAVAAIAWALTIDSAAEMGNGPGTMGQRLGAFLVFWVVMMAGMMLPTVAPVAVLYLRATRARATGVRRVGRVAVLLLGYLGAWAVIGLPVYAAALGADALVDHAPGAAPWVGAGILLVAGYYQLTPMKDACLTRCRSPLGFLMRFGSFAGRLQDLRVGVYHGAFCIGCCWALMGVLVAVGLMNVAWMAGLAALMLLEKTWRYGRELGRVCGVVLIAIAFFVPWNPQLVPGLQPDGGTAGAVRHDHR